MGTLASYKNGASDEVCNQSPINLLQRQFAEFSLTVFSFSTEVRRMVEDQEYRIDDQEQYSRRNCLVLHNVPEHPGEDPYKCVEGFFKEKLGVNVGKQFLDRVHRLNTRNKPKTEQQGRPMIVKFSHYHKREEVFNNKKLLKGSNVSITESLTQARLSLLKKCKDRYGNRSVWSMDGKIAVLIGKKKYYLTRESEMANLPDTDEDEEKEERKETKRVLRKPRH